MCFRAIATSPARASCVGPGVVVTGGGVGGGGVVAPGAALPAWHAAPTSPTATRKAGSRRRGTDRGYGALGAAVAFGAGQPDREVPPGPAVHSSRRAHARSKEGERWSAR